jgi:UDP-GlcNAc3NAcA epimerase
MTKLVTIVGARPQFVKAAMVSRAIVEVCRAGNVALKEVLVHTGQHYDDSMSSVFFREMRIPEPAHSLGIGGTRHGEMTGRMLSAIEAVLATEQPDAVLVYGDTNSTLAGALAAAKLHIPVAHVEAGLRSFNKRMPEEINRVLSDHMSRWHFCPTTTAVNNLALEGLKGEGVQYVGDVMCDAAMYYSRNASPSAMVASVVRQSGRRFYLATVHRAENTDDPARLGEIMATLDELALDATVILPLHPRTAKMFPQFGIEPKRVKILEPVGYFDMLFLLQSCCAVLTDSGGLQKEAYFFRKPCVTMREETEWIELIEAGCNILAGADRTRILNALAVLDRSAPDFSPSLYGQGDAGLKIATRIAADLGTA